MDIQKYLIEKQQYLEKHAARIRYNDVFNFNYIPPKPLMREETKPVIDALLRYQQSGIANNVLILGFRGSGKSVIARYLMKVLGQKGKLHFVYANCRQCNTSFKIVASLLGVRPRGTTLDELWYRFSCQNRGKTVFILDEVDLISEKDKNKEILYLLSRSPNNYMAVLLSNNPKFLNTLDDSTLSTLQPEIVHFRSYNAVELQEILTTRARIGLGTIPVGIINEIAAMTVKNTNSDVRVAIKTLYCWASEPDVPLNDHFEKARRDILVDVLKDLNDKNFIILRAALSEPDGYVKDIYDSYKTISTAINEDPFSYVHFYSSLSYLQSLGLILLISTKVNRTYANRIQLTFDPAILNTIWQIRFS
jgi:Cdc6-like AAA superfamily ATPase